MKSFPVMIVSALLAVAAGNPAPFLEEQSLDGRIIGGETTEIEKQPYQVSVQLNGKHYCGGSIISPTLVLTAAHCTQRSKSSYTVRCGSTYSDVGGSVHNVKRIVNHPKYVKLTNGVPMHDIAVIELSDPIEFDEFRKPIELYKADEETEEGSMAVISGWGTTESGSPRILHKVDIPVITKDACNRAYRSMGGLPIGQICAAVAKGGKDSCQGDSGGPMAVDNRLAGVVSWGRFCAVAGNPGVYTEVAYYRNWIKRVANF